MKVSVIIPTLNGERSLPVTLDSILKQEGNHEVEIVVVDSSSRDRTREIAERFGARVLRIDALAFTHGYARNLGASMSGGDALVFCNQDVVPVDRSWISGLVEPLENPDVAASYSRQVAPVGTPYYERSFLLQQYPPVPRLLTRRALEARGPAAVVLFSTVAGALRRDIWETFKFDQEVIIGEDQEIAYRILTAGHTIAYAANSMVFHSNIYTLSGAFKRYFDSGWGMTYNPRMRVTAPRQSAQWMKSSVEGIVTDRNASLLDRASGLTFLSCKALGFALGHSAPRMPQWLLPHLSHTMALVGRSRDPRQKKVGSEQ